MGSCEVFTVQAYGDFAEMSCHCLASQAILFSPTSSSPSLISQQQCNRTRLYGTGWAKDWAGCKPPCSSTTQVTNLRSPGCFTLQSLPCLKHIINRKWVNLLDYVNSKSSFKNTVLKQDLKYTKHDPACETWKISHMVNSWQNQIKNQ